MLIDIHKNTNVYLKNKNDLKNITAYTVESG